MITREEINAVKLSATKKDFYQLWNEVLESAHALSERWDPENTNESDPGIVLLKELVACVEKLAYLIDVATLENFMPSAAQMESMRKLCDMLGYTMKYYRSATTDVKISFNTPETSAAPTQAIQIDRFTNIKDIDDTINYVTLAPIALNANQSSKEVPCIEGELVECETDDDNIISLLQLDDNNRYYFPETQIAENGIFVSNISDNVESAFNDWERVNNLNTQPIGKPCYKFGFDSRENLPYIQFPADISNIIEDGLKIKYIRTSGVNGNISKNTLYKMEKPLSWLSLPADDPNSEWHDVANYTVTNLSAAKNGMNAESLNSAYNNYKKTIGTFDTLVTCKDYMDKIYQFTLSETNTTPLVSNIIVSDIRDDINRSVTICKLGPYGVEYIAGPRETGADRLTSFDLIFYPFKTVYGLNTKAEYVKSFKYDTTYLPEIKSLLEDNKTYAHNIITPRDSDIACIKNYYNLKATITTTRKVNTVEQADILNNIYSALFENFNMRKLDFGEEIPDDEIITVIKEADARIKNVGWQSPKIETAFCLASGYEGKIADEDPRGKQSYNKLALNNVLAGRIPLFKYDENFKPEYDETADSGYSQVIYPKVVDADMTTGIATIEAKFKVEQGAEDVLLHPNEVIQFRSKSLKTDKTYPAYVNYYLHLDDNHSVATPATMYTFLKYLTGHDAVDFTNGNVTIDADHIARLNGAANSVQNLEQDTSITDSESFTAALKTKYALFTYDSEAEAGSKYAYAASYTENTNYYYLTITSNNFIAWYTWLTTTDSRLAFYSQNDADSEQPLGYLVDANRHRYVKITRYRAESTSLFVKYWVPETHEQAIDGTWTIDGLGADAAYDIRKNTEYQLKQNEYLLFNYTQASATDSDTKTIINEFYGKGTIIKANFDITDSSTYHSQHSYSKTSGYDFTDYGIQNPGGMFTLSADQQIEKRSFVEIVLDGFTNLYWTLNNEIVEENDRIYFPWNEEPIYKETGAPVPAGTPFNSSTMKYSAYVLKDGEYVYYTNQEKTDIAYYGAGVRIKQSVHTPDIYKTRLESTITAEDIATLGLSAAIPWRSYNLGGEDSSITVTEYQYINLVSGSILEEFRLKTAAAIDSDQWKELDIDPENGNCPYAYYKLTADSIGHEHLPALAITIPERVTWEVKSKLELNLSPTEPQKLYNDSKSCDTLIIKDKDGDPISPLVGGKIEPAENSTLSIKANRLIQSTSPITFVGYTDLLDTENQATYYNCQLKVFETVVVKDNNNNTINLNNYGNGQYTMLNFKTSAADTKFASFSAAIPEGHLGIITAYYNNGGGDTSRIYLKTTNSITPYICNNSDSWWASPYAPTDNKYPLKPGINVICLSGSCNVEIWTAANADKDTILLGDLDLVFTDEETSDPVINPDLAYNIITEDTVYDQIMADIALLDPNHEFYYNALISNENAIELNDNDDNDNLASTHVWYSYNNINNKFVISEINADTLISGIVIGQNSKI